MRDEARVISMVRAGSTDAFTEIVERYQEPIIRYLLRLAGEHEVALDLAQDTFVLAYEGILKTNAELSLKPWSTRLRPTLPGSTIAVSEYSASFPLPM